MALIKILHDLDEDQGKIVCLILFTFAFVLDVSRLNSCTFKQSSLSSTYLDDDFNRMRVAGRRYTRKRARVIFNGMDNRQPVLKLGITSFFGTPTLRILTVNGVVTW